MKSLGVPKQNHFYSTSVSHRKVISAACSLILQQFCRFGSSPQIFFMYFFVYFPYYLYCNSKIFTQVKFLAYKGYKYTILVLWYTTRSTISDLLILIFLDLDVSVTENQWVSKYLFKADMQSLLFIEPTPKRKI